MVEGDLHEELSEFDGKAKGGHLNWCVQAALDGNSLWRPNEIALRICQLLRSDAPIEPETREMLADAFERGRDPYSTPVLNEDGHPLPHFKIAGIGPTVKLSGLIDTKRNWFDAAEALEGEPANGRRRGRVVSDVSERFGFSEQTMRKYAQPFYQKFKSDLADPSSPLNERLRAQGFYDLGGEDLDPDWARSVFIEMEAAAELAAKSGS